MNLLYLAPSEPYPGAHAGFTHVHNLLKNLVGQDVDVTLVSGREEEGVEIPQSSKKEFPGTGSIEIHRIKSSNPITRNIKLLGTVRKLRKKKKFDIIHERMETAGGAGAAAAGSSKIPYVLEVNDPFMELNAKKYFHPLLKFLKKFQIKRADAVICQTPQIKAAVHDILPGKETFVIPNGADPLKFPAKKYPKKKKIGFIGSFMPWHGVNHLLTEFSKVREKHGDAELLVVGDAGEVKEEIIRKMEKMDISDSVEITGKVSWEKIPELLSSCSLLAAPFAPELDITRKEYYKKYGFWWSPLKIFEYMASSRPVVTSNIGSIGRYVGNAGICYEPGEKNSLSNAISELLSDRKTGKKMGRSGRERVEKNYNWKTISQMTKMAYVNVLEKHGKIQRKF